MFLFNQIFMNEQSEMNKKLLSYNFRQSNIFAKTHILD